MERKTYQQILDELANFNSWLSNLGLSNYQSRIHRHISNICKLQKSLQDDGLNKLINKTGTVKLMWSLVEALEFSYIYACLQDYDQNLLRRKLSDALRGPSVPNYEKPASSSNIGRNIMFELNVASRLRYRKIPVDLRETTDIVCKIGLANIYIQCKRPFIERKIPANILAARRQLTRDLNNSNDKSARGIIAISVSRALNPGDKLFAVKTESDMGRLADDVQDLANKYSKTWKRIVDTRIIGVLFHIITPAFIEEISLLTAAEHIDIFSLALKDSPDRFLLRDLAKLVKKPNSCGRG